MFDPPLISNLRRFSGREEAAAYLDLVGDLLTGLSLDGDDRRFHFNPTTGSNFFLPLTINHRYIVVKGRDVGESPTWWLIHPGPHAVAEEEEGEMLASFPFAHKRHDAPESAPLLVQYRVPFVLENLGWLSRRTLALAARDLVACHTTPGRVSHNPLAYALALDDSAREAMLSGTAFTGFTRTRGRGRNRPTRTEEG